MVDKAKLLSQNNNMQVNQGRKATENILHGLRVSDVQNSASKNKLRSKGTLSSFGGFGGLSRKSPCHEKLSNNRLDSSSCLSDDEDSVPRTKKEL